MKNKLKATLCGTLATAIAGVGLLAATAAPAFAANGGVPPWEPDANAGSPYGNVQLFNADGVVVTSGSVSSQAFAFAAATTAPDSGSTHATVYWRDPQAPLSSSPPATWSGGQESNTTPFSPPPSGTPATVVADAASEPVAEMYSTATVNNWLTTNTPSTTTDFANTIQVILQDSFNNGSTDSYWSTDIAYNTGTSAITVDGVNVPAGEWVELFPLQSTPATPTLTLSAPGAQTTGTPEQLTASGVPTTPAGDVVFEDNGATIATVVASGGSATYTVTSPAAGSHSYTASFVPVPGSETGAYSSSATVVTSSTSAAETATYSAPTIGTSTSLSAGSTSINYGASDALTATVTENDAPTDTGVTGSVQFYDGASALGSPVTTTVSAANCPAGQPSGSECGQAVLTTSSLPTGTDSITATFTPGSAAYGPSTSSAVTVTVAAPAACSLTGSSCTDIQGITVTVNPGTITITTPYTPASPFVLPAMQLSSDGTYLQSSATFPPASNPGTQQIVVTSQLAPAYAWTLSVSGTALSDGTGGTIPSSGLGLTNGALLNPGPGAGTYPGAVTFTNVPAHNPSPVDTDTNSGLTATPQTFAHSTAADGTAVMDGTLTLLASTATPAGTYTGTITFTIS